MSVRAATRTALMVAEHCETTATVGGSDVMLAPAVVGAVPPPPPPQGLDAARTDKTPPDADCEVC